MYNKLYKNITIKYNSYCNHSTELLDILEKYKKNNNLQITKIPISYDKPEIVPILAVKIDNRLIKEHVGTMSYDDFVTFIES